MELLTGSPGSPAAMSVYDRHVWDALQEHWQHRSNRRGLPHWMSATADRTSAGARDAVTRATAAIPERVKEPVRRAGDAVASNALRPTLGAATALLELVDDWAAELNDPASVEKLARKHGLDIASFTELHEHDLKECDRLLKRNTLRWRTAGALEGGAMGALALVPVAGIPLALTADILVVQVLSVSIASRIAYSYGYDAKDPAEQAFIQRLVHRSFVAQAVKVEPLRDTSRAWNAARSRTNWSAKLRDDHRLLVALEKLMTKLGPAGSTVSVKAVAKVVPYVGVLIGAGTNSAVLGNVAADAQRYCQTRFLCDRYGLPLPVALAALTDDDASEQVPTEPH